MVPQLGKPAEALVKKADEALDLAKRSGRAQAVSFSAARSRRGAANRVAAISEV
jgi:predicted signal transduction protein with EAL and GGDEF domain